MISEPASFRVSLAQAVTGLRSAPAAIGVPDEIIVDNAAVAFAASANWSTGTSVADKYGSNYRFRPAAAVSDSAV